METQYTFRLILISLIAFICSPSLNAQDTQKEIIIIEKTIDANGNVVSKNIKRNQGNYSEDEIQEMIEDEGDVPMLRSFDLEGMGWGDDLREMFSQKSDRKPTLGVALRIENDQLVVASVADASGAEQADIRVNDKIISINDIPVSTVGEIQDILAKQDYGDKVQVVIWRDGQEIEKDVLLKSNSFQGLFGESGFDRESFDLPNGQIQFFGDIGDIDMDSIMTRFRNMSPDLFNFDGFDMDRLKQPNNDNQSNDRPLIGDNSNKRPQLGLFIEDTSDGIAVTEVIDDSPADNAGIKAGDVLTHIDDNVISSYRELSAWMNTKAMGDEAIITVNRNGKSKDLDVSFK